MGCWGGGGGGGCRVGVIAREGGREGSVMWL